MRIIRALRILRDIEFDDHTRSLFYDAYDRIEEHIKWVRDTPKREAEDIRSRQLAEEKERRRQKWWNSLSIAEREAIEQQREERIHQRGIEIRKMEEQMRVEMEKFMARPDPFFRDLIDKS